MAEQRRYEIRLFDRTLVEFALADGAFSPEVSFVEVDDDTPDLMPCGLAPTAEGVWNWLEIRSIPTNRRNAARICRELGFDLGDLEALYRASMGLSLNDSYWVVPRGFTGRFDDYNLYENPFSEAIGALAVAGEVKGERLAGNTPELTTDGTLRKGWRIVEGQRVLYKGASDGFVPGEPLSEYVASLVARDLGLNAVAYGIDSWEGETCSTCADFATRDVAYVPFAVATGKADLPGVLWWCSRLGDECFEQLCDMLVFDALVCNVDRHLTNFGVLRDSATGKALGLAPLFDNGRALFPNVADDDALQFELESQLRGPAFGGLTFEELVGRVIGLRQRHMLEKAVERGIVGNVLAPGRRVAALDSFMRRRAECLLEIPPVDHAALKESLQAAIEQRSMRPDDVYRLQVP